MCLTNSAQCNELDTIFPVAVGFYCGHFLSTSISTHHCTMVATVPAAMVTYLSYDNNFFALVELFAVCTLLVVVAALKLTMNHTLIAFLP